jgi:3-hydroxyacyl-CoA dehydrogenase/enoyl-CoA hydratase/3-hydroxybutyryl-CoA epimerase
MLTSGQTLTPQKAKSMGLITRSPILPKADRGGQGMIKAGLKPVAPWDEKGFKLPGGPVYSAAGANLWPPAIAILRRETYGNYPAAAAILKCVYEGLLVPFDTALRIEQRYFTEILQTTEAAAMIRSLFVSLQELNKGARRPEGVPRPTSRRSALLARASWAQASPMSRPRPAFRSCCSTATWSRPKRARRTRPADHRPDQEGPRHRRRQGKAAVADHADADYADLDGCDLVIEAVFEDSPSRRMSPRRPKRCSSRRRSSPRTPRPFRSPVWPRTRRGRRTSSASTSSRRSTR